MDPYLTAASCSPLRKSERVWHPNSRHEQVCPATDRLHGDVYSLGGPWDDDKLEGAAI